ALATAFALGVTSPIGSGLGGIAGFVVWRDGKASSFDGSTRAPLASRPGMFELVGGEARSGMYGWPAVKNDANVEGPLSVSVPGAVAAYELAHRRPGKLPCARHFEPAIRLARDGIRGLRGILSREDFASYAAGARPPQTVDYRGDRVVTLPGLTGGPAVARALGLLDRDDLRTHAQLGAQSLHRMAVAVRAAFAERLGSMADMPNTTHVNAVDRDRMCVALTATLGGGFGSAVMIRGTGIVLTNGTYWFDPRPGRPNSIAPGKRVLWAGAPTIVLRAGEPFLVCGAPGGRKIMSAVVQTVVNAI